MQFIYLQVIWRLLYSASYPCMKAWVICGYFCSSYGCFGKRMYGEIWNQGDQTLASLEVLPDEHNLNIKYCQGINYRTVSFMNILAKILKHNNEIYQCKRVIWAFCIYSRTQGWLNTQNQMYLIILMKEKNYYNHYEMQKALKFNICSCWKTLRQTRKEWSQEEYLQGNLQQMSY